MSEPFSLAIADVDFFKKFNDTYGHAKGDDCLRAVAQSLASVARRPSDLAARYGGEEFALILPGTDAAGMRSLMGRLLARIRTLDIPHASSATGTVTISAGAITLIPGIDENAMNIVTRADELLYEAKQNGRNQVQFLDATTGERLRLEESMENV
jgi:diguanylate cyclase (GGDEF)-like protein